MHTRFSGRVSPLTFDPEIERTARQNRVVHRTAIASPSQQQSLPQVPMANLNQNPEFAAYEDAPGNQHQNQQPPDQPVSPPLQNQPPPGPVANPHQFQPNPPPPPQPNDEFPDFWAEPPNVNQNQSYQGTSSTYEESLQGYHGSSDHNVRNWDDGINGDGAPHVNEGNIPPGQHQQIINPPPPVRNNPYLRNPNMQGYPQPQQHWYPPPQPQGYPQQQPFNVAPPPVNMQPPPMQNPYGGGMPYQQNLGVPGMYQVGIGPVQGVDSHFRPGLAINASPVVMPVRHGRSFEAKQTTVQNLPLFCGRPTEEPYQHLIEFEHACQITGGARFLT